MTNPEAHPPTPQPVLYSFRRCPYAMRARLAMRVAGQTVEHREIELKHKSTALLRAQGFDEVFHLQGGILKYLETVPEAQSQWRGECFVFDERVSVGHGLQPGGHQLCRCCRQPLPEGALDSPEFELGVSCPRCFATSTDTQKDSARERQRQWLLAKGRAQTHIGRVDEGVLGRT